MSEVVVKSLWEKRISRKLSKFSGILTAAIVITATVGLAACGAATYSESSGLPNTMLTPGAVNPAINQNNIDQTICVSGWTKTVRPPVSYTNSLKYKQLHEGYNLGGDTNMKDYEEDHIVPLEVGGNPSSPLNLFPEPRNIRLNSYLKDQLENEIHLLVCHHQLSLKAGQAVFLNNWEDGYRKYVGKLPS